MRDALKILDNIAHDGPHFKKATFLLDPSHRISGIRACALASMRCLYFMRSFSMISISASMSCVTLGTSLTSLTKEKHRCQTYTFDKTGEWSRGHPELNNSSILPTESTGR